MESVDFGGPKVEIDEEKFNKFKIAHQWCAFSLNIYSGQIMTCSNSVIPKNLTVKSTAF